MTCRQLGGACDHQFHAETFEQMAEMSKQHAMEMMKKGDPAHLEAMKEMQQLMQSPEAMQSWMRLSQRRSYLTMCCFISCFAGL